MSYSNNFQKPLDELNLKMGSMKPGEERDLINKNLSLYQTWQTYWNPAIATGKKCYDYLVGDVLTPDEKTNYRNRDKTIIQIPELLPKLNSLIGMQINTQKQGITVAKRGENAPEATIIDDLIKTVERENDAKTEYSDCFKDAIITSFPSFMWYDKETDWTMDKKIVMHHESWDAILPDPNFSNLDLSDCNGILRLRLMSYDKLLEMYPKREKEIRQQMQYASDLRDGVYGENYTSNERDEIYQTLQAGAEMYSRTGRMYVIERYYFKTSKETVYVSPHTDGPELLPEKWDDERVAQWQQLHPDYEPVEMEIRVLMMTSATNTNILLDHGRHWWQEGEYPCEMYIPQMLNNKPRGIIEFMLDNLKLGVISDIEHIHSIRLSNDNLMIVKTGSIVNAEDAAREKGRAGGIIIRSKNSEATDIDFPINRREQTAYTDLKQQTLETSSRLSVDRNFEGGVQTSQESGKSIEARVRQTNNRNSPYMNNFNQFALRARRKICKMIPYCYTEEQTVRFVQETSNKPREEVLNQEVEFDWEGTATKVVNNLSGAKYDYIEAFGDDSISGQEAELSVFQDILQNVLPNTPQDAWGLLLTTIPNRLANDFGRKLQEQAEQASQQEPQPDPMKLSLSIDGKDVLYNELVQTILKEQGVLPQDAQTQPMPPEQQSMPPQPAMTQ